jgi:hypothetical protein
MVPNTIRLFDCLDCGTRIDAEKARRKMRIELRIPDGEISAVGVVRDANGNIKTDKKADAEKSAPETQNIKEEG